MHMFKSHLVARSLIIFSLVLSISGVTPAQTPAQTPAPTPPTQRPTDPTKPPGQEQNPNLPPGTQPATQNPTAPPGTQQNPATAPPGTQQPSPTAPPGTNPVVTPTPVPGDVTTQEPREPVIPSFQAQPLPPLPDMSRLGVTTNTIPLSLNDAIKRALENNNDIEVARDDVRYQETQLRSLEGIFDPFFSITPQIDKRVIPVQNIFGGGGTSGQLSNTTFTLSPGVTKQFSTGGGNYQAQFSNTRTKTSATNSTLNPYYSSNLSLSFTQPL